MLSIVDTNVIVLANDQSEGVVEECVDASKKFISTLLSKGRIALDEDGEVLQEYINNIQRARPYGLGAQFLIRLLQVQYDHERVERITLAKSPDGSFLDFPIDAELSAFDQSDKKFAVLAKISSQAVTSAVDDDWVKFGKALHVNGITVNFLCGHHPHKWFLRCCGP